MSESRLVSRRSRLLPGLAAAAIAVLVSACGSSGPTPAPSVTPSAASSPSAAPSTTPTGGTMTVPISADLTTWDPCVVASTAPGAQGDLLSMVYGNLVWTDTKGVVEPGLAESLTTTDNITWTLKLRQAAKFIDGHPYDADAVKYNWDRMADPANACTSQSWVATWDASLTVRDARTLTIKLPNADSSFGFKVAELIPYVASPAALAAAAKKADIKPIGAGPFEETAWNPGVSSTYVRNSSYWDSPRPYLDGVKVTIVSDTAARTASVAQGAAQFMFGYPYQFGSSATAAHVATYKIDVPGFNILWLNNKSGPLSDVRARQAIWAAIDMNQLVQALTTDPSVKAPTTYVPSTSPYYDASLTFPTYDKAKAQKLFDQVRGAAKALNFKITAPNNSDTNRAAVFIQQVLDSYSGVTATINSVTLSNWNDVITTSHDFDIGVQPGILVYNSPEPNTYSFLRSGLSSNPGQYSSTKMDTDLAAAMSAVSGADKKAAYVDVQKQFLADLPFAIYGLQNRSMLMRDNTCGIVNAGQGQLEYQYLYIANFPGQC